MNVVRVEKNKDYSVISNGFLRNKKLSFKAKGLLANIMTHSDGYEFSINGIVATSQEGKTAIYAIIKELIYAGYATREQDLKGNKFNKVTYTFYETNEKTPFQQDVALSGFTQPEVTDTQNPPQRNTNDKERTKIRITNGSESVTPLFNDTEIENNKALGRKLDFEYFWDTYNKKKSRAKCWPIFSKLTEDEVCKITECVADHVIITPNIQYRKHPLSWLNQKCWEDDISEELSRFKPLARKTTVKRDDDDNLWN